MTTLKQFLKPDWRKIVIFILLLIVASIEGIGIQKFPYMKLGLDTIHYYYPNPLFWVIPSEIESIGLIRGYDFLGIRLDIIPIQYYFISLIYWYILSCLIVWIYNKLKRK